MSATEKGLVFEYWFRIVIGGDITIADIAQIVVAFADEYEKFIPSLTCGSIAIANNGAVLETFSDAHSMAFGQATATPGRQYHWKIKVINSGRKFLNLGIITAQADVKMVADGIAFFILYKDWSDI